MANTAGFSDFTGKLIMRGDKVIAMTLWYRRLEICRVIKVTQKMVFLREIRDDNKEPREFRQFHNQVIKYNGRSSD